MTGRAQFLNYVLGGRFEYLWSFGRDPLLERCWPVFSQLHSNANKGILYGEIFGIGRGMRFFDWGVGAANTECGRQDRL